MRGERLPANIEVSEEATCWYRDVRRGHPMIKGCQERPPAGVGMTGEATCWCGDGRRGHLLVMRCQETPLVQGCQRKKLDAESR